MPPLHTFRLAQTGQALVSWRSSKERILSRMQSPRVDFEMPDRESLRARLVSLLEEEMGESYALPEDEQDLRETLGLDSVDLVGLVMRIEREFHVRLGPEELALVKRVGDLLDLMETKLAARVDHASAEPTRGGDGGG